MTDNDLIDTHQAAQLIGWKPQSIRKWRSTGRPFPAPDAYRGPSPLWTVEAITTWRDNRPGRGAGGGRPRTKVPEEINPDTVQAALNDNRLRTVFSQKLAQAYLELAADTR